MKRELLGSKMYFCAGCALCASGNSAFLLESMVSVLGFWACRWCTVAIGCLQTHVYSHSSGDQKYETKVWAERAPEVSLSILSPASGGRPTSLLLLFHLSPMYLCFFFCKDPRNFHSDLSSQDQKHNLICGTLTGSPGVVRVKEDRIATSAFDLPPVLVRETGPPSPAPRSHT